MGKLVVLTILTKKPSTSISGGSSHFTEFFFNEDEDIGIAIVEVYYERGINIHDALGEMINCEFCHDEVEYISIMPL